VKELSPAAKALIQRGKGSVDPNPVDQDRVFAALQGRIATGEGATEPAPNSPPTLPPKPWGLISVGGVGAGLVAAAVAWGLAPEAPSAALAPAPPAAFTPAPAPARETGGDVETAPAKSDVAKGTPPPAEPARLAPHRSDADQGGPARTGPLAEEVALLSRATAALHAGDGEDALRAVAEHQQKFPRGVLSEERRSARAQALCLLGRTSEAKRELDRLSPTSPQAARARERCGL